MTQEKKSEILNKLKDELERALDESEKLMSGFESLEEEIEEEEDAEVVSEEKEEDDGRLVLPMIPLRGLCIFPRMILHFDIGREKSIQALEKAMIMNKTIFLATQKDENTDLPTIDDFYHVGTIAKVKQLLKLPGDAIRVLVEGVSRGEIEDMVLEVPYF